MPPIIVFIFVFREQRPETAMTPPAPPAAVRRELPRSLGIYQDYCQKHHNPRKNGVCNRCVLESKGLCPQHGLPMEPGGFCEKCVDSMIPGATVRPEPPRLYGGIYRQDYCEKHHGPRNHGVCESCTLEARGLCAEHRLRRDRYGFCPRCYDEMIPAVD